MRGWGTGTRVILIGSLITITSQFALQDANAAQHRQRQQSTQQVAQANTSASPHGTMHARAAGHRRYARAGGISCVPFARADSGIAVAGNAWQWWDNAEGRYARGDRGQVRIGPRRERPVHSTIELVLR